MELAHGSRKVPKFAPEDIISSMPEEVISNILGRLPLQDAVRTSILSSCWKSKWTMLNQLVFDVKFFRFLKEREHEKHYGRIIYGILLRLKGAITMNQEFTLKNMNETPLELPSHLFSCRELKHLKLYNCYVCPKSGFQGFQSLLCLDLSEVVFEGYTCGELISRCPSLEILKLRSNTGGKIKQVELAKLGNLKVLILQLRELVNKETIITSSSIFQIIGLFPKLQKLNLNFWKRKLSADAEMNILTALPYLKTLRLYEIDFSNEIMVSCVIDLLRGFSHLETLLIKAAYEDDDPALAISSSKAYFCKLGRLHLRKVTFVLISCTENEVCLMKSLLACSPLLKKMVISPKSSEMFGGDDGERKFVAELMLHRASPVAKIVFESSYDATTSHD
ncbi:F-box/FBD/LRR-repeat protein-like protein [Tanacetum coccineum]|uniref:F-box/FBD/LRR-repeat protein-like protein n=1 Tax=Tanacetum coccineum TaxID=301880 RepID=A0ABQ5H528_9ASTR